MSLGMNNSVNFGARIYVEYPKRELGLNLQRKVNKSMYSSKRSVLKFNIKKAPEGVFRLGSSTTGTSVLASSLTSSLGGLPSIHSGSALILTSSH